MTSRFTGSVIAQRYRVERELGNGSFGKVYRATDLLTGSRFVVKRERPVEPTLRTEAKIYQKLSGQTGFSNLHYRGRHRGDSVIVLDRFFTNLYDYIRPRLAPEHVAMLVHQLLSQLESLHNIGYIHCDLKPNNIMVGEYAAPNSGMVHLIDLGLACRYVSKTDGAHKVDVYDHRCYTPVSVFAPVRAHQRKQQSRRDDLESLGFLMLHWVNGKLPWTSADLADSYRIVAKKSQHASTLFNGLPARMEQYMRYVRQLRFESAPDYHYLRALMQRIYKKKGYTDRYSLPPAAAA